MNLSINENPNGAQVASKDSENKTPKTKVFKNIDFKAIAEANRGFNLCPADVKSNDVKKSFLLNAAEKNSRTDSSACGQVAKHKYN